MRTDVSRLSLNRIILERADQKNEVIRPPDFSSRRRRRRTSKREKGGKKGDTPHIYAYESAFRHVPEFRVLRAEAYHEKRRGCNFNRHVQKSSHHDTFASTTRLRLFKKCVSFSFLPFLRLPFYFSLSFFSLSLSDEEQRSLVRDVVVYRSLIRSPIFATRTSSRVVLSFFDFTRRSENDEK